MTDARGFARFWPRYVAAHRCVRCRVMHYIGTTAGLGVAFYAVAVGPLWWLAVAPMVGYLFAWLGHWLFAGNRPETFGHPFYSLVADFKMLALACRGRMRAEVDRHAPGGSEAAATAERPGSPGTA